MSRGRRLIALLGVLCLAGGTTVAIHAADAAPLKPAAGAVEKPTAPAKPRGNPLAPVIVELQKEYQAYVKEPKSNKLREKSDYFGKGNAPSADITPEVVLKSLEASVSGGPGAEAYVKWQLLSAVQGKFADDLVKRVVSVYHRSPSPGTHPGADKRRLTKLVERMKKDQVPEIQKEFDQALGQFREDNKVITAYRDELYSRLPPKLEALSAGLEDAIDRAGHGLNATGIFDNVAAGIRTWTISEAKAGQIQAMINAVYQVKDVASNEANKPFNKVYEDKGQVKWKSEGGVLDPKKPEELIKFLENNSGGSSGGLKFKDGK